MITPKGYERPEEEAKFQTASGIPVKAVYTPSDVKGWDYVEKASDPGEYPYTRGRNPASQPIWWNISQYAGYGTAESTNRWFKYILSQGAFTLSAASDLPTQLGLDSDHPLARGEVGRIGVAIDSLQDVEAIYRDIPIEGKGLFTGNNNALGPINLAWEIALCEKQGVPPDKVILSSQNDSLKEFVSRGAYIFPPKQALKFSVDVVEYCHRSGFNLSMPIIFCEAHMYEGGASKVQSMAFMLANTIAYLDEVQSRGIEVDDLAMGFYFLLGFKLDLFEEIAACRALRRIWARVAKERYNCKQPLHLGANIIAYGLGSEFTAQQPLNNIVRGTIEGLAAVLGGAFSLNLSSYDEALAIPTPEALTLQLRTQQILANETGIVNTVDPLGGSYYVESLTDEIETRVTELFEKVEGMGGSVQAVESGFYDKEITRTAYQRLRDIESGRRVKVGVNMYQEEEKAFRPFRVSMAEEKRQIQHLRKLRRERDNNQVKVCLRRVREAAMGGVNPTVPILDAVKAYATLGEICHVLEELWGRYRKAGL